MKGRTSDYGPRLVLQMMLQDVKDFIIDRNKEVEAFSRCVDGYSRVISEKKKGFGA